MVGLPFTPVPMIFHEPQIEEIAIRIQEDPSCVWAVRTSCCRRVVLVPGSPDDTPRSIQDRSCASNRFSVLVEPDAEDGQPQHHDIGTPPPTADEGDIDNNGTASLVGQPPSWEGTTNR